MRFLPAGLGMLLALSPTAAQACRQLIPSAKFERSDLVVEAEAFCLETTGVCELQIFEVLKGDEKLSGSKVNMHVDETPPQNEIDGRIVIGRCPQTFEPWQSRISGRFYLVRRNDGTLFAAHPPDATTEAMIEEEGVEPE
ncbi:hypothetical protein [Pseudoblastomonas halimionae]|uniref:Uncharacterized protein n=1 Tax=Alteriqipengyuania halimionae TaxID=1926630 RepID=A0A6I4U4D7_9SPHN|nr:hypothetical protein [Alteriqipengyuania halimionae]MXP09322.1 hypothetical protein [Alteriqipengyuania halimionae]